MNPLRILREVCVGETRQVLLDETEAAIALKLERSSESGKRLELGSKYEARVRSVRTDQGGAFVEVARMGEAFLRSSPKHKFVEGEAIDIEVAAEPRLGKLARVVLSDGNSSESGSIWDNVAVEDVTPGNEQVAAAFEEALSTHVTIPHGGRLHIERTKALIAVDIDAAGRADRGTAASRALRLNTHAAQALCRQLKLRNYGGLVVMDCVSPLNRNAGQKLQEVLKTSLADYGMKEATVLAPSRLGLIEMSLPWLETPIAERIHDENGSMAPESLNLAGLRMLEREALTSPMKRLTLELPASAFTWLESEGAALRAGLAAKYGERFSYRNSTQQTPNVYLSS